jgi:putative addiction module component (TIGR02574 family)
MSTPAEELSRQALALRPEERVRLAQQLLATVQQEDAEVEAAWDEELKRRIAEIDAGTARLIPAEDVFAEIRRLIK